MVSITVDKSEFESLKDCKVGEPLVLHGTVSAIDGDTLTIEVSDATYDESAEEPAEEAEPAPSNPVSKIGVPGGMKKSY